MNEAIPLFEINPGLDRAALKSAFAEERCVQIKDVLTSRTADVLHDILERRTPWGLAWHAAGEGPENVPNHRLGAMTPAARADFARKTGQSAARGDYAFLYGQ